MNLFGLPSLSTRKLSTAIEEACFLGSQVLTVLLTHSVSVTELRSTHTNGLLLALRNRPTSDTYITHAELHRTLKPRTLRPMGSCQRLYRSDCSVCHRVLSVVALPILITQPNVAL